jgi:hypothetical protein
MLTSCQCSALAAENADFTQKYAERILYESLLRHSASVPRPSAVSAKH